MRVVIGFCNACALTAMESWLSHSSDKNNRGKVLATYNAVVLAGLFGGQFLMNIATPINTSLFVIAGILLCAATIPISLSTKNGHDPFWRSSLVLFFGSRAMFTSRICYLSDGCSMR
jgi:MFS family permease|tara:strand:- start:85 stop:435 length:351 start_codon:yes stop_codon:yes gene_type:complete